MSIATRFVIAAAVCALAGSPAYSDLKILKADGSPASQNLASRVYNAHTGGWDITLKSLYAPGGATIYNIRGDGGEIIDNIWVDVPCWEDSNGDCIPAGSPVLVRVYSDAPDGIRSVHNIEQTGTAETLLTLVEVVEDIGSITIQTIGTLEAGRDILGPIEATTPDNAHRGVGVVSAGRDILGSISATRGHIKEVHAGRHIGSQFNPVFIEAKHNYMWVTSQGETHADITTGMGGGSGYLARIRTDSFFGTIRTPVLGNPNFTGRVRILDEFKGSIIIDGSLSDHVDRIELPVKGFEGQVVINAANQPNGVWTAPVQLGPPGGAGTVILKGPFYDQPSDALGGGAVGLVPFRLHGPSCSPANGSTVTVPAGGSPPTVRLEHYGPVTWGFGQPVTVARRPIGAESPFTAMSSDQFVMTPSTISANRVIVQTAPEAEGFQPGYEYRLRPAPQLLCDVPSSPPVLWHDDYIFVVQGPQCPGDLTNTGVVNVSDLLLLLAFWGPSPAFSAADLNGDGVVDVSDLLILLANWGPCSS